MHVRVRIGGVGDSIIVVIPSRLSKIKEFRKILHDKFEIAPELQRLFYGGKLLEDHCTFHDYNIKLNDVIQLMPKAAVDSSSESDKKNDILEEKDKTNYEDAVSLYYSIGDLIDVRINESHAWFEGKISRILKKVEKTLNGQSNEDCNGDNPQNDDEENRVSLPNTTSQSPKTPKTSQKKNNDDASAKKSANKNSSKKKPETTPKRGIADYFTKQSSTSQNTPEKVVEECFPDCTDDGLFYQVTFVDETESIANMYALKDIRPRSRRELEVEDIKVNDVVLVNYNIEDSKELGLWFDFLVQEVNITKSNSELIGTVKHANAELPNMKLMSREKIYAIEKVKPLKARTAEEEKLMKTPTETRKLPITCRKCRDVPGVPCSDCGCNVCISKENPNEIILCDECNRGFHMKCLTPPLEKIPSDDWYCQDCKRDTSTVIAPGAAKQAPKHNSKSKKDWGKGMACVGKTQSCSMPAHHFGPIPGVEVGMIWRFRIQVSEAGVHRPPVSGIHGRDTDGAYSIVLSGGYEDDYDDGFEFTYTGSGGRDLSGNRRTAEQSCDQQLIRENKALARSCAVKEVNEEGADAGDNWKDGKPIRVVRSYKMVKHFPQYAPKEGVRYDGIYKVVKYYPETGKAGFRVWKYLLRRDDPNLAPWEKGAKAYSIVYPDGFLEAEAEKKALKEKQKNKNSSKHKRVLKESNGNSKHSDDDVPDSKKRKRSNTKESPTKKKMKTRQSDANDKCVTPKRKHENSAIESPVNGNKEVKSPFTLAASKKVKKPESSPKKEGTSPKKSPNKLTTSDEEVVQKDELNKNLWDECVSAVKDQGRQGFINKIMSVFLCIICQEVAANPVTTSCGHNFCKSCLKLAFKTTESQACPYCRCNINKDELSENDNLKNALKTIMPGYDARRK